MEMGEHIIQSRDTSKYCNDRAGHWETKSKQAAARGKYDKAGEYRTKALQWAARGKRAEEARIKRR
nr:hypothetical protein [Mycobacterium sp. E3298]